MLGLSTETIYQAIGQALHTTTATRQSRKGEISSWKAHAPAFAGKMAIEAVDRAMRGETSPTLLSLLDTCRTGMGSRLLRHWLTHPARERSAATARHAAIEVLMTQGFEPLRDALRATVLKPASLTRHLASIAKAHRAKGMPSPTTAELAMPEYSWLAGTLALVIFLSVGWWRATRRHRPRAYPPFRQH